MIIITIPRATGKEVLRTLLGFSELRRSGQPCFSNDQWKPCTSICQNTLSHKHPKPVWLDRLLALVHLDYPKNHFLLPELMMPFYTFKTNISCPVPGHWEGADSDPASSTHQAPAWGVTGRDTLTVKVEAMGSSANC